MGLRERFYRHLPGYCDVTHPLDSVRQVDRDAEADPGEVGLRADAADRIGRAMDTFYREGLNPAVTLCIRRHGKILIKRSLGYAHGNGPDAKPGERRMPLTPDTPFCLFSASKAVTAMLVHLMDERGKLHLDDRIAEWIPEFGKHGKGRVTVRDVLTHRAALAWIEPPVPDIATYLQWDHMLTHLCELRPQHRPGRHVAYHALTGGYLLGEVLQRAADKPLRDILADEMLRPLGFQSFNYGISLDAVDTVATSYTTGLPVVWPVSAAVERVLHAEWDTAVGYTNTDAYLTGVVPAGNIVGTADELSRFFQLLLQEGELDGERIMAPHTVRRALVESSGGQLDWSFMLPVRHGMGMFLGTRAMSLFGPDSEASFGHLGFMSILGWADPKRGIAGGLMTNGKCLIAQHLPALYKLLGAIHEVVEEAESGR